MFKRIGIQRRAQEFRAWCIRNEDFLPDVFGPLANLSDANRLCLEGMERLLSGLVELPALADDAQFGDEGFPRWGAMQLLGGLASEVAFVNLYHRGERAFEIQGWAANQIFPSGAAVETPVVDPTFSIAPEPAENAMPD